jgi:uncharacterized protein YdeI (YjbR/CyaY-like superfamily)
MKKRRRPQSSEPTLTFETPRAMERWLRANHAGSSGFWLQIAKKGSREPSVSYAEALELALAWGWIDGHKRPLDEAAWLQRFTPRGPKSRWSKLNRDRATALIAAGKMQPPGLAEVERAKADGRWDAAYDSPKTATIPEDLAAALKENPTAAAFFKTLNGANRYAILYRLNAVKRAETRARKLETYVAMLARGEKLHP